MLRRLSHPDSPLDESVSSGLKGGLREVGEGRQGRCLSALPWERGREGFPQGVRFCALHLKGALRLLWGDEVGEGAGASPPRTRGRRTQEASGRVVRGGQGTGRSQSHLFAKPLGVEGPHVLEALALLPLACPVPRAWLCPARLEPRTPEDCRSQCCRTPGADRG